MSGVRRYAVARYASFEGLAFSDAITAIYPHGIRALLFSFMAREQSLSNRSYRQEIQRTLYHASSSPNLTAYDRTGLVRCRLHELAINKSGQDAHLKLNKICMRNILSLLRLYFSNIECQAQSAVEMREILIRYEAARAAEKRGFDTGQKITGEKIQNWRLRSLQPLVFYFPYSARHALRRLISHDTLGAHPINYNMATNELALMYCEIELMRLSKKGEARRNG